jgi:hypothetical protein
VALNVMALTVEALSFDYLLIVTARHSATAKSRVP